MAEGAEAVMRVRATSRAESLVRRVADSGREDLIMVLGNGCCDSTAPYLYDRYLPGSDVLEVGRVAGVRVMAHRWLADLYPGSQLTVDVDEGVVNDSFSLETAFDCRFTLKLDHPRG